MNIISRRNLHRSSYFITSKGNLFTYNKVENINTLNKNTTYKSYPETSNLGKCGILLLIFLYCQIYVFKNIRNPHFFIIWREIQLFIR